MIEEWKYLEARRRVRRIKKFYSHFTMWLVFSVIFIFLNLTNGGPEFWAIFPIMGWGIGVLFHAISVFGLPGLGHDWEDRLIERELERIDREEEIREWREEQQEENPSPSSREYPSEEPALRLPNLPKQNRGEDFV